MTKTERTALRDQHLATLRELLEEARTKQDYGSTAALMRQIEALSGFAASPTKQARYREPDDLVAALEGRLNEMVLMRQAAAEKGSFDSAARMLILECKLADQLASERTRRAEVAKGSERPLTDDELVEQTAEDIIAMPPVMRRRLLALVEAGGRPPAAGSRSAN